ncbi:N-glycosylase/DNA lyase OGG1 isoform X2 [Cucurbita maxima]|uniref:DNA-(apurinic or apyrimidinic site) lyase n=1 Tax=Cucurbita maxima TaxID=3661 RepID=A0A6J1JU60_CUCMA|nr:N-glycosylase/DNA lyase OGG1 isoform X2 [Cucurbita maxima]XP_022993892.1 N-glycosylase/DNA lyase OGG1 isoform X2 [Cucurbita maxima]
MPSLSLRHHLMAKRLRPTPPSTPSAKPSPSPSPPSLPPSPPTPQLFHSKPTTVSLRHSSNDRSKTLTHLVSPASASSSNWVSLNLTRSDLSLPLTFPTGQTFRWKQTSPLHFTGVVGPHLISLTHLPNGDVSYCLHFCSTSSSSSAAAAARLALLDFLNAGISLRAIWEVFSAADPRFDVLSCHLEGARVLRQDPLECLIQFLCSSNNNIGRITKMVDYISSLGNHLGNIGGFDFHEFPSLERLSLVSEAELREAGFGYRAKYIIGTVKELKGKPGGGAEWLLSLRDLDLDEVIEALTALPGVGPKVAACVALFSLDQHHAIPVDTHVWQIATRYLVPELAGARLTPKLCNRVAEAFVSKYGKYAGWAQTLLFVADLPQQKALLPASLEYTKRKKSTKEQIEKAHTEQDP